MAFQVEFTDEAIRDIESIFEYIHVDAPLNAVKWRKGLDKKGLHLLTFMADSFGLAKESRYAPGGRTTRFAILFPPPSTLRRWSERWRASEVIYQSFSQTPSASCGW